MGAEQALWYEEVYGADGFDPEAFDAEAVSRLLRIAATGEPAGRPYDKKGPAVAFLIPDEVDEFGDDDQEWQDIAKLLEYAKTL